MKRLLLITLIAAFVLSACASKSLVAPTPAPEEYRVSRSIMPEAMPQAGSGGGGPVADSLAPNGQSPTGNPGQAAAVERLVIQNADLAIVVPDVAARMKAIEDLAAKMGGYVVSSSQYQNQVFSGGQPVNVPDGSVVIRVPADKLDAALAAIKADVVEVQSESRTGQDVTADYVDQQSTLKNLEATEAQLNKILDQATTTEDVLNVFNQLTAIRQQIEVVKGQIKYYEESAAMSAISVHVIAEATIQPIVIAGWKPAGVARDAIQDLINFSQGFANWLIRFLLFTLPALIMIAIPFYLIFLGVRAIFRRFRKPKVIKPEVEIKK